MSAIIRHRVAASDLKAGDTLLTHAGTPAVTRVMPTKKGDKVQVFLGRTQPLVLGKEDAVWITRARISQVPTQ